MRTRTIRIATVILTVASLGWLVLIVETLVINIDWETSPARLILGFVLLLLTPIAYLLQLIILRALMRRSRHTFAQKALIRGLLTVAGPIGAGIAIFREARRLETGGEQTDGP
jgi:hypothetical protein